MFHPSLRSVLLLVCVLGLGLSLYAQVDSPAQLIRKRYLSETTGKVRDYYVYLPKGYASEPNKAWPMMLFLHGAGERGNGRTDLEKVLIHGPLMEAWVQGRDLPMIIVAPQAPFPDDKDNPEPVKEGFNEKRSAGAKAPERVYPLSDTKPIPEDWGPLRDRGDGAVINAWVRMEKELSYMVRMAATEYKVDRKRIYLSGISMGGFGSFAIGAKYPEVFAAIAPVCGGGDPSTVGALANAQRPMWIFHGGRDRVVSPSESLRMVNALLEKGNRNILFTVHEDLGHNVWTRIYAGEDFYRWILEQRLP